ncbi:MAG: DUF559 domain-containing protein [Longispora sp.]|nr:DUF559 domain-containing protein [Longispora sp. (in: high G+C Gram-positive bacteria)]
MFVTHRGRTIFDCLRILPFAAAESLLDRALQERWTSFAEQAIYLRQYSGILSSPKVGNLLRRAKPGARSAAERLLILLLRQSGISEWRANFRVNNAIVDIAFPSLKLAIEVDGRAWHSADQSFERDRQRQNEIVSAGWQILRFTWRDLNDRPDYVIAMVQTMLRSLSRKA